MGKFSITAILGVDSSKANASLKGVGGRFGKLGGIMKSVGKMAAVAFAAAAAAFGAFAVGSIKKFMEFEKKMAEVFTLLPGESKKFKDKMSADILEIGTQFGMLTEETVPALYQALSAGVPKENVMEFLKTAAKLSIGGVMSLKESVSSLAGVLNAYGKEARSVDDISDIFFTTIKAGTTTGRELAASLGDVLPIAAQLGIDFKELGIMMAVSTSITGNTAKSVTGLKGMMAELAKAGMKANTMFELAAGKSFPEFIKEGNSMEDALKLLDKHAKSLGLSLLDMFGNLEGGVGALQQASDGFELFASKKAAFDNFSGATKTAMKEMSAIWEFQIDQMKARWEKFQIMFGAAMGPVLEALAPLTEAFMKMLEDMPWDEFNEMWKDLGDAIKDAVDTGLVQAAGKAMVARMIDVIKLLIELLKLVVALIPLLNNLIIIVGIIEKVGLGMLRFVVSLLNAIISMFTGIGGGVRSLAKMFGASAAEAKAFEKHVLRSTKFIRNAIQTVIDVVKGIYFWVRDVFVKELRVLFKAFFIFIKQDGSNVASLIKNLAKLVFLFVTQWLLLGVKATLSVFKAIKNIIFGTVKAIIDWALKAVPSFIENLKHVINAFGTWIYGLMPKWMQKTVDYVLKIIETLWESVKGSATSTWLFIKDLFNKAWKEVSAIFKKMKEGLSDVYEYWKLKATAVWDWVDKHFPMITGAARTVYNGIMKFIDFLVAKIEWVFKKLGGMVDTVNGWFGKTSQAARKAREEIEATEAYANAAEQEKIRREKRKAQAEREQVTRAKAEVESEVKKGQAKEAQKIGREQLLKAGVSRKMLEGMMKAQGISSFEEFYRRLGAGELKIDDAISKAFGAGGLKQFQKMQETKKQQQEWRASMLKKGLSGIGKDLGISQKELIEAFQQGRLKGPLAGLVKELLAKEKLKKEEALGLGGQLLKAPEKFKAPKALKSAVKKATFKKPTTAEQSKLGEMFPELGPEIGKGLGEALGEVGGAGIRQPAGLGKECCNEIAESIDEGNELLKEDEEEKEPAPVKVIIHSQDQDLKVVSGKDPLKVFIVEGTAPIRVLEQNLPLPVWIMGGEKPINVIFTGQEEFMKVDLWGVADAVPVTIVGVLEPIEVYGRHNIQLEAIWRLLAMQKTASDPRVVFRLTQQVAASILIGDLLIQMLKHTKAMDGNISAIRKRLDGCIANQ